MDDYEIFERASEIADPAELARFLDQACADAAQRQRLEVLLVNAQRTFSLLERNPGGQAILAETPGNPQPGQQIGPYTLIQKLGEGGMGTVWEARQAKPLVRTVALKLIRADRDSRQVLARFDTERQALAILDHANIAKVLDAGSHLGRPFFVMELVAGSSITSYCDEHRLGVRERLQLFVPVCQAVQHAHQKGIIHRDLKPSNVLVAVQEGQPVPKVIDFGLAKALKEPLSQHSVTTRAEQLLGTLEYMSPEQADDNRDVDTRSDVYSLGVMLYELITGHLPLSGRDLQAAGFMEALRRIREDDPPPPSKLLAGADDLANVAAQRDMEPARLRRQIQGEIDWIVLKALRKDRSGRYAGAQALAQDLENFLDGHPVQAGPDSAAYRLSKLVRKYKTWFAAGLAASILLLVTTAVSSSLAVGLYRANRTAEAERQRAEANFQVAVDFLKKYGRARIGESGLDPAAFILLETALAEFRRRVAIQPSDVKAWEALADAASLAAEAYRQAGKTDQSQAAAREAVDATRRQLAIVNDAGLQLKLAHRLEYLSVVAPSSESLALEQEARAIRTSLVGQHKEDAGLAFSLFLSHFNKAVDLSNANSVPSALTEIEAGLAHAEAVRRANPHDDVTWAKLENGYALQADLLYRQGQADRGRQLLQAEIQRLRKFIAEHSSALHCRGALAMALSKLFFHAASPAVSPANDELEARQSLVMRRLAEPAWHEALGPLIDAHYNVGVELCAAQDYEQARDHLLQAERLSRLWFPSEQAPAPVKFRRAETIKWLAEVETKLGGFKEALAYQLAGAEQYEQLAAADPGNFNLRRDQACLEVQSEVSLWNLGRRDEALNKLMAGGAAFQSLADLDSSKATQNDFATRWRPVCLYIAAASFARAYWRLQMMTADQAEKPDPRLASVRQQAIDALQAAIAGGFDRQAAQILDAEDLPALLKEEDWTALRTDPEIRTIVTRSAP